MATPKPQPFQARDKLAFLLSLVPYLMDRDRIPVSHRYRARLFAEQRQKNARVVVCAERILQAFDGEDGVVGRLAQRTREEF